MKTEQCNALDRLIIDKMGFTKEKSTQVRAAVPSGEKLSISRLYAVKGTISIGSDYSTTPTVHIPLKATLAILIQRMGFQREKALQIIRESVTEAILNNEQAAETLPVVEDMLNRIEDGLIAHLPKVERKGAVVLDVTVTRVDANNIRPIQGEIKTENLPVSLLT